MRLRSAWRGRRRSHGDRGLPPGSAEDHRQERLLPVTAITLALSCNSGALASRIGPRLQVSGGSTLIGASADCLTEVRPGVAVLGFGLLLTVTALTCTVLAAALAEHADKASAVNNDVARAAGLIAVTLLPAAGGITGIASRHAARFCTGFRTASLISAALCIAGRMRLGGRDESACHGSCHGSNILLNYPGAGLGGADRS